MREKFERKQTVNDFKREYYIKSHNLYNPNSTLVSPDYTFSLARNIFFYTPIRHTNREKYFNHISYKGKNTNYGGK